MTVSLKAMSNDEFSEYLKISIQSYAKSNVESGRWDASDALERSQNVHADLLPHGNNTDNNFLFNIHAEKHDEGIGHVWVKIEHGNKTKSAFIYDIEIYETYRRKGYAKSALKSVETFLVDLGVRKLGLHVFNYNSAAISLYESIGYEIVSHNMQKKIGVINA